jgi:hypothetical protein
MNPELQKAIERREKANDRLWKLQGMIRKDDNKRMNNQPRLSKDARYALYLQRDKATLSWKKADTKVKEIELLLCC